MKKGSVRGTLIAIYMLTMCIALVLGLGIYQIITVRERMAKKYLEEFEITKTCEDFLGLIVDEIDKNSLELVLDGKVEYAFVSGNLENNFVVQKVLGNWLVKNTEVKSVHMMSLDGKLLSESSISTNQYRKDSFINQFSKGVLEKIDEREGRIYIGIGSDFISDNYTRTLFIARRINASDSLQKIGYMFYFLDEGVLQERLEPYLKRNQSELVLVDDYNHVINFGEAVRLQRTYGQYAANALSAKEMKKWKSTYDHAEIQSESLGIRLIGGYTQLPVDNSLINIVIALSVINFIFLCIGTIAIKNIVITPLEKISNKARQISVEGTLATRFETDNRYREESIIVDALNEMLNRINQLIREGEERERQKRILELSVINHQVNPHFLFNTLNSVGVLIAVEDKKTALKLVKGLAKYYRVCLSQENNTNTIEQEIDIMREYVHIVELKNPDLIRLHMDVDENLYSKKVPRMILQTLVENSIKYGIKTIDEPLEIDVVMKSDTENERTIITIRDNGKGMEEEIRQSILQGLALKDKSGFGLKSTIKRISLMYEIQEVDDIINIDSKLNEYTMISFYIPWE